jgi:hypothetical protein
MGEGRGRQVSQQVGWQASGQLCDEVRTYVNTFRDHMLSGVWRLHEYGNLHQTVDRRVLAVFSPLRQLGGAACDIDGLGWGGGAGMR